jgi:hypothetical protein
MRTLSRSSGRTLLPLLLSLCCFSCARPVGNEDAATKSAQPVPFRNSLEAGSQTTPSPSALAVPNAGSGPTRGVPFHPQTLPAGTLLSVRLNEAISSDNRGQGSAFTASLDEPIVVDGRTVLAPGANVSGRVESAQASSLSDRRGYLCMKLNSIEVGGRDLSMSTSTLYAKGTSGARSRIERDKSLVQLERGRHLTFRLSEPLSLSIPVGISTR